MANGNARCQGRWAFPNRYFEDDRKMKWSCETLFTVCKTTSACG